MKANLTDFFVLIKGLFWAAVARIAGFEHGPNAVKPSEALHDAYCKLTQA
jgi:hypothetical protein